MNKKLFILIPAFIYACLVTNAQVQDSNHSHLIGFGGGVAFTSNPSALQERTGKSHYVDWNGGITYMYRYQGNSDTNFGHALEVQVSLMGASANVLQSEEDGTRIKFILPLDFRYFIGSESLCGYLGLGLQYSTVARFYESENGDGYYDYWSNTYYEEDDLSVDFSLHQLALNLAPGFKIGYGYLKGHRPHSIVIGAKFHFPLINSSEFHGNESSSIDLSKDKLSVSLTGSLSWGWKGGAFKLDAEYPLGGTSKYTLNDGGHSTFANTHSWSISGTFLFNIKSR